DTPYWKYLLLSISGYELYLKTYRTGFDARNVVEQIVLNEDFPRSVIYSVNRLYQYFERLKSDGNKEAWERLEFMIGRIRSKVKYSTVDSILREGLHVYLSGVKEALYEVGNALNQHYFAYS
ncbi:MAG TPA: alpha-E domain-containing protein, partial [Puia sp.]|nr:alpha-E domain-containing protein [Puia sp.]